ncbi:MAG: hypothetical protein M3P08_14240 [Thermoproteota archaeon]|nr:hypothetical protein [Thermoproteota archaeon]
MTRAGRTECSSFQTGKAKTIVKNRLQFVVGITVSLFLIAALVAASIILPLAYAQQIRSINNPATNPINHIVVIMQENRVLIIILVHILVLMGYLKGHAYPYLLTIQV